MTGPPPPAPRLIHWAGTISLGIIWGTSFLGMTLILQDWPPLWVAAGRLLIGGAVLFLIDASLAKTRTKQAPAPLPWLFLGLISAFGTALPFALLSWGLQHVPSAFAGVSMAAVALFVLPLAHLLVPGENLTLRKSLGLMTGFIGVVILIGPGAFEGTGLDSFMGRAACLLAALCYAISSILTRLCPPIDPIRLALIMTFGGAALLLPVAIAVEGMPPPLTTIPLLALIWIGLLPTGIANLLRVLIVRSAGPGFMSLTSYQVPIWSVIFGTLVLHEALPPQIFMSLALILGGIAITRLRRPGSKP